VLKHIHCGSRLVVARELVVVVVVVVVVARELAPA
jgi:hypothetical protein